MSWQESIYLSYNVLLEWKLKLKENDGILEWSTDDRIAMEEYWLIDKKSQNIKLTYHVTT